jgi:hypothetical protein
MYEACAVLFSSRHLSRKAARIDAEIDERVNDGSADERGDDNYQHFQAEGTHTGSPPSKRRYRSKAAIPRKHARGAARWPRRSLFPVMAANVLGRTGYLSGFMETL